MLTDEMTKLVAVFNVQVFKQAKNMLNIYESFSYM